jgi:hypothetical protein
MNTQSLDRYTCNRCFLNKPSTDFSEMARAQARAGDENAMCQECVDDLYNSRLGRSEVESYLNESEERRLQQYRLPGQEERKDNPSRWGRVMHHTEFVHQLGKSIPNLHVRDGNLPGDISLFQVLDNRLNYICYTNSGYLPEYSIVHTNEKNLPIKEQRGWRTVLLRLINSGVISEADALKYFGHPTNGEAANFYLEELQAIRNRRG